MKFSTAVIAAAAAFFGFASASPMMTRQSAVTDTTILNYALTLEHLEATFYKTYLDQFDAQAFADAGFEDWVRGRLVNICNQEQQHVALLTGALGAAATAACDYTFPVTDPRSFVELSQTLEEVGVSAYLGAAALITTPAYVTVAGSILTTEARHQAWVSSAGLRQAAWSVPEDTPLSFSPVYTAALQFIKSCPASNPTLPFTQFAALTYDASTGAASYPGMKDGDFLAIYQGLSVGTYPITGGVAQLPATSGFAYVVATSEGNATLVGDANIVAGPVILNTVFDSKAATPPAPMFTSAV